MIDISDHETLASLRKLQDVARTRARPIALWLGAGVSKWAGYPLWDELAKSIHKRFKRRVANYDEVFATSCLDHGDYPSFFQVCQSADRHEYFTQLNNAFGPRPQSAVYKRVVRLLNALQPVCVLTTNVDELLERSLSSPVVIQSSDAERMQQLIIARTSFICKLHGSVSALETLVFTTNDYESLMDEPQYIRSLRDLLASCSVVFMGYSLRDSYLISLLEKEDAHHPILGIGPHFLVAPAPTALLPAGVKRILYSHSLHSDHRSSLRVLELIIQERLEPVPAEAQERTVDLSEEGQSGHYISELFPPGEMVTQETAEAKGEDTNDVVQFTIGPGFHQSELQHNRSTAMHDLVVGLLCYERVWFPASRAARIHELLGSDLFWQLVREDVLRLVYSPTEPCVLVRGKDPYAAGEVTEITAYDSSGVIRDAAGLLARQIVPVDRNEASYAAMMDGLVAKSVDSVAIEAGACAADVRSSLVSPALRRLIGMSEATPLGVVPFWLRFPILRISSVVRTAQICKKLGLRSAQLLYGGASLADAVFSSIESPNTAGQIVEYVLCGQFGADISRAVEREPRLILAILRFRDTPSGAQVRKAIQEALAADAGADLVAAINGGLRNSISFSVLQSARSDMLSVLAAQHIKGVPQVLVSDKRSESSDCLVASSVSRYLADLV